MEIVARIVQNNSKILRTHLTEAAKRDTLYLSKNPFQIFFRMYNVIEWRKVSTTRRVFIHVRASVHRHSMSDQTENCQEHTIDLNLCKANAQSPD